MIINMNKGKECYSYLMFIVQHPRHIIAGITGGFCFVLKILKCIEAYITEFHEPNYMSPMDGNA